jgi:hypothetical protein
LSSGSPAHFPAVCLNDPAVPSLRFQSDFTHRLSHPSSTYNNNTCPIFQILHSFLKKKTKTQLQQKAPALSKDDLSSIAENPDELEPETLFGHAILTRM